LSLCRRYRLLGDFASLHRYILLANLLLSLSYPDDMFINPRY
jgi:hypothetical protein